MYRRLVLFGLSVVAVAVIALVIPLGMAARDIVRSEEMGEVADHARRAATAWELAYQRDSSANRNPSIEIPPGDGTVTLILPDGRVVGPQPSDQAVSVVDAAKGGMSATLDLGSVAFATVPVALDDQNGVVLVTVDADALREGLLPRLVTLAAVSVALLAFAALAAWLLARRTVRPIQELARTADAIADGDLSARVRPSTIKEVSHVGVAMNRMTVRVQELLDDERANAAELAHQLRTPLTVLTVDIDSVADDETRARLQEDALALQRTTDEIITNARRSAREGLRARCDAATVVAERAGFWEVLAEDQHRAATLVVAGGPLWVRLTADDLATLIDILLQNVFIHTPEGTPYDVRVGPARGGGAVVTVRDHGPGFAHPDAPDRSPADDQPGTTGLGLPIATRLAQASGGRLDRTNPAGDGALVTVMLGPAGT